MASERDRTIAAFLEGAGFGRAARRPLAGDASARRYERLTGGPAPAVLMDCPPDRLDVRPFLQVGERLRGLGFSVPDVLGADPDRGLVLLEDLGDGSFTHVLAAGGDPDALYGAAVDLLVELQARAPADDLPLYDDARMQTELALLPDWYAQGVSPAAAAEYRERWAEVLPLARVGAPCLVYVDYHADNLIWLPERSGHRRVGLLDFQDARAGPPAYDLVSLLEDARRDVPPALAVRMVQRYLDWRSDLQPDAFRAAYAVLGAQRNSKILGLFTRLARRDGKPHYLRLLAGVLDHLAHDLEHSALAPLRPWYEAHVFDG